MLNLDTICNLILNLDLSLFRIVNVKYLTNITDTLLLFLIPSLVLMSSSVSILLNKLCGRMLEVAKEGRGERGEVSRGEVSRGEVSRGEVRGERGRGERGEVRGER